MLLIYSFKFRSAFSHSEVMSPSHVRASPKKEHCSLCYCELWT